ncbi:MAG: U32 family peptidase, partial [Clostridia bacterium]|nr:U32 family peptidase [Clostridia bacterium]
MRRKTPLPELLAPAGSPEALYAAISAGADAVYLGGRHSARAFAKNFDEEALRDAVAYAHLRGVKIYLALNTLLFDRELPEVLSYADRVAALGIDAAIVADRGLMRLLRRHLPELPLHASTQAFIHNTATADYYASLGVTRVVAARELSGAALREMIDCATAEVEVFLHGALCVSHSGQCLFSSLVGGRSGNRGECAQPCRLPYGGGYPLSLSDLSLARHIPELVASGVSSLKIEGRMKSPSYVAGVTGIYRRLLDEGRAPTAAEEEELLRLFSRSGFTDKYYTGR